MADAARKTDIAAQVPSMNNARDFAVASTDVLINDIGAVREGDSTKPPVSSVPGANASQTVFINGKKAVRKGDKLLDGTELTNGSNNVNIGD